MARGRPPKPTALKVFEGNPGKRDLNNQEPQPKKGAPSCPKTLKGGVAPGRHPGKRHPGWWLSVGFAERGQRLLVNPNRLEQALWNYRHGHHVPPHSFLKGSGTLLSNWRAGRMPPKARLTEHLVWCVPSELFPNGFESSREYLERHNLLTELEESLLFGGTLA
jgi:hypothetical protein